MSGLEIPVTGVGYDALEAYLESDRSPPECMLISDLDGFLTGIAIGPEVIMPSEWLPEVWGGEEAVFEDGRETQAVLGGIMSRLNEIHRNIDAGIVEPIFWTDNADTVIPFDWAEGFMQAVGLRSDAWEPLFKSKRDMDFLLPIAALCGDENGESALGLDPEAEDELMEQAPEIIPACVIAIADFWRKRRPERPAGLRTETFDGPRIAAKPGRNDPCPCGSGKKFKKCCGG